MINSDKGDDLSCCKDIDDSISCNKTLVNFAAVGDAKIEIRPLHETLKLRRMVGDSDDTFQYENRYINMILTYNPTKRSLHGHVFNNKTSETYVIQKCGNRYHEIKLNPFKIL